MIYGYESLKKLYPYFDEDQYQPNGIDLKLHNVEELMPMEGAGIVDNVKTLPKTKPIKFGYKGVITLEKNKPYVFDLGYTEIPNNVCTTFEIRSTLMRMGAILSSSLGDGGFHGHLRMIYYNPIMDIKLKLGERVVQMITYQSNNEKIYDGDYNEEVKNI